MRGTGNIPSWLHGARRAADLVVDKKPPVMTPSGRMLGNLVRQTQEQEAAG